MSFVCLSTLIAFHRNIARLYILLICISSWWVSKAMFDYQRGCRMGRCLADPFINAHGKTNAPVGDVFAI
jgi:hypothetical protein